MKKFAKISSLILSTFLLFLMINKLIFKDRVSVEDYRFKNNMETNVSIESYKNTKDGILINIKIKNDSNYVYTLKDAKIMFGGTNQGFTLNRIPIHWEGEDIMYDGIQPNEEGYVEFLLPKGMKIDEKYFDLECTKIVYEGKFKGEFLISEAYIIVGNEYKE
ncbi:MAG: hypothetical protein ACRDD7_09505 [Peptostreptococcaceae bacterium]